jgi:hypothetical protein
MASTWSLLYVVTVSAACLRRSGQVSVRCADQA